MSDARVNGVRLYYEERGRGAAIMCIHGTSSSAMVWSGETTDALAKLGRVIIYDRRGCTRSERPEPYETSVAQHSEDAAALISEREANPAIIVGRSYGGAVAVGVALRHPGLVRALVLLEPADLVIDGESQSWNQEVARAVEAAAAKDVSTVAEVLFRSVLGDAQWEAFPEAYRTMFADNSPAVLAEVRGVPLSVKSSELAGIKMPVLLVAGEASHPEFRQINERLAAALPRASTILVGGGHLINPGEPRVLAFIRKVLDDPAA
jgi:pimeloyl-ACP methyl ester carboxylesterase